VWFFIEEEKMRQLNPLLSGRERMQAGEIDFKKGQARYPKRGRGWGLGILIYGGKRGADLVRALSNKPTV